MKLMGLDVSLPTLADIEDVLGDIIGFWFMALMSTIVCACFVFLGTGSPSLTAATFFAFFTVFCLAYSLFVNLRLEIGKSKLECRSFNPVIARSSYPVSSPPANKG